MDISDLTITDTISVDDDIGWALSALHNVGLDSFDDQVTEFGDDLNIRMFLGRLVVLSLLLFEDFEGVEELGEAIVRGGTQGNHRLPAR